MRLTNFALSSAVNCMQLTQDKNITYSSRLNSRHIHLEQQSSITS